VLVSKALGAILAAATLGDNCLLFLEVIPDQVIECPQRIVNAKIHHHVTTLRAIAGTSSSILEASPSLQVHYHEQTTPEEGSSSTSLQSEGTLCSA
jgi:hypothetical protein